MMAAHTLWGKMDTDARTSHGAGPSVLGEQDGRGGSGTHVVWPELALTLEEGQESTWQSGSRQRAASEGTRDHLSIPQSSVRDCNQKSESGVHMPIPGH